MTSKEYIIWMKGFIEACNEYAPTPKQWDTLKDKLKEVNDSYKVQEINLQGSSISTTLGYPSGSIFSYTTSNK